MKDKRIEGMPGNTPKEVRKILDIIAENPISPLYIHGDWCKKCGICIAMCPFGALEAGEDGTPQVIDEKCKRCGTCELRCPDLAITVLQTRG